MFSIRWLTSPLVSSRITGMNILREYCKVASANSEHDIKDNPFYGKYAVRIAALQKISVGTSQSAVENDKLQNSGANQFTQDKMPQMETPKMTPQITTSDTEVRFFPRQKALSQIMRLELLQDKSPEDVEMIWKQYHKEKPGLYAVLPADVYAKMYSRFAKYPTFLFPLPRSQGYEFVMSQFLENSCHFTSLINYQAFNENAPVCLTITYFTELKDDKGIILMKGEFDENSLKVHEAQCLTNQLQLYYGTEDGKKEHLLWTFNSHPDSFKHMDLIADFEYSLGK